MFHFTKIIAKSTIQFYMQIKKLGLAKRSVRWPDKEKTLIDLALG